MVIKLTKANLFYNYLLWLDPMLNLTKVERQILAAILTLHYFNGGSKEVMDSIFIQESLDKIRQKLKLSDKIFKEGLNKLSNRGYITQDGVAPLFTSYPKNGKFEVTLKFEYE